MVNFGAEFCTSILIQFLKLKTICLECIIYSFTFIFQVYFLIRINLSTSGMRAALIIFVMLVESLVLQSSVAREIKVPKFSKLFQKYSRDTPRVVSKLRRQLNLPKEKSAEDVVISTTMHMQNMHKLMCFIILSTILGTHSSK